MTFAPAFSHTPWRRTLELSAWLAIVLWVFSAPEPTTVLPRIGRNSSAPSLAHLTTLDGQPLITDPTKKIFLTFFGVHCYWSEVELPALAQFAHERADVQVIAVAFGAGQDVSAEGVRAYLKGHPMPYVVALDSDGRTAYHFGVTATPTSFVINPTGLIRYARHGGGPGITAQQFELWADFIESMNDEG